MNATSFSTTLTATASPTLDGTLIECFNGTASPSNMAGNGILQILGQCGFTHGSSDLCVIDGGL